MIRKLEFLLKLKHFDINIFLEKSIDPSLLQDEQFDGYLIALVNILETVLRRDHQIEFVIEIIQIWDSSGNKRSFRGSYTLFQPSKKPIIYEIIRDSQIKAKIEIKLALIKKLVVLFFEPLNTKDYMLSSLILQTIAFLDKSKKEKDL
jgi:hypothetical protein